MAQGRGGSGGGRRGDDQKGADSPFQVRLEHHHLNLLGQADFNQEFFRKSPNILSILLPEAKRFEEFIKVIDVPAVTDGKWAHVVADPRQQKALCFISNE